MVKKIRVIIFVLIMCFLIHTNFVYAEPNLKEDIFKDTLLTLVSRNINDAIVGYYGEYRDFHLYSARVMEIRRIGEEEFHFIMKLEVETEKKPYDIGLETITLEITPFTTVLTGFSHKTIQDKKPTS